MPEPICGGYISYPQLHRIHTYFQNQNKTARDKTKTQNYPQHITPDQAVQILAAQDAQAKIIRCQIETHTQNARLDQNFDELANAVNAELKDKTTRDFEWDLLFGSYLDPKGSESERIEAIKKAKLFHNAETISLLMHNISHDRNIDIRFLAVEALENFPVELLKKLSTLDRFKLDAKRSTDRRFAEVTERIFLKISK